MWEKLKMIWNLLTSKEYKTSEVTQMGQYIQLWLDIYHGKQKWNDYKTVNLNGKSEKRKRKSMKAAKIVAKELAGLIFSEYPELIIDDELKDFLEKNNFLNKMTQYTEYGAASGGFALKLYSTQDQGLQIDYVTPDCFIPVSWDNKRIYEADFLEQKVINNEIYVRIEKHRKEKDGYRITSEFYKVVPGSKSNISVSKDKFGFTGDVDVIVSTETPLFSYFSTPEANNIELKSPLGISMYANSIDTLESIDIAFDALSREILLGRKRIIVPAGCIKTVTDVETGQMSRYFDASDDVFQGFESGDSGKLDIKDNTVELRIDELKTAVQTLLDILSIQVGFSAGFISFDSATGIKTATEVITENSKTWKTKKSYENQIKTKMLEFFESIKAVAPAYDILLSSKDYNVVFNDNIIEDRNSKENYWSKRYSEGTTTLSEYLQKVDGLNKDDADKKAEEIRKDQKEKDTIGMFDGADDDE